jgi:hypothetical protein
MRESNEAPRAAAKAERVAAIREAARVRRCLGQGALHRRVRSGQHEITWRGRRYVGTTLEAAIAAARTEPDGADRA